MFRTGVIARATRVLATQAELGAVVLAAGAGGCAWVSLGTLAVTDSQLTRVGTLPSLPVLASFVIAAAALSVLTRLHTREAWPLTIVLATCLPWLPWRVPAALLVFDGAAEVLLWALALGGVAMARISRREIQGTVLRDSKWAPSIAGVCLLACSLAAASAVREQIPGGDEPHYLVITQSLLYDGDLRIENNHTRGDYAEYLGHDITPDYLKRGRDGEIYSIHAPGISALVLPAFAMAGYSGTVVFVALLNAFAVALMWRAAHLVSGSASAAWIATLAIASSATFFFHTFAIYPDPIGAAIVAGATFTLARLEVAPGIVRRGAIVLTGAGLALLPWLHTRFALVAGAMGIIFAGRLIGRSTRWRDLVWFAAIPVASAAAWFGYFSVLYGAPDPTAPYGGSQQTSLAWIPAGLTGLAIDQQFGLFSNAPALALTGVGLLKMWRTRARLVIEYVLVATPYVVAVAAFGMWWGGWSAPARFLLVVLPLCAVPLACAWTRAGAPLRFVCVALIAFAGANVIARSAVQHGALIYNVRDGFDRLMDAVASSVSVPLALPSVHRVGMETSLLLGTIYVVALVAGWLVLTVLFRRSPGVGARWTLTMWTLMAVMSIALTASWRVARTAPLTIPESKLTFVQNWRPDRRSLGVMVPSLHFTADDDLLRQVALDTPLGVFRRGDRPLLSLARVPAGDYRLEVEGASEAEGAIDVSIGPTSQPTEHWPVRVVTEADAPRLHLPAAVHSITIRGDAAAQSAIRRITLRPEHIVPSEHLARRAARYGTVRVFFLDDGMFMESGGIWTRGDSRGDMIVVSDDQQDIDFTVAAGPVAVTLTFAGDTTEHTAHLAPGEARRMRLPAGRWSVATSGRFAPRDHDEGSRDSRPLGARIEF